MPVGPKPNALKKIQQTHNGATLLSRVVEARLRPTKTKNSPSSSHPILQQRNPWINYSYKQTNKMCRTAFVLQTSYRVTMHARTTSQSMTVCINPVYSMSCAQLPPRQTEVKKKADRSEHQHRLYVMPEINKSPSLSVGRARLVSNPSKTPNAPD